MLLMLALLAACRASPDDAIPPPLPPPTLQPTPSRVARLSPTPQPRRYVWARTGDYVLPCWDGVLPGTTTLDEAEALLRANEGVRGVTLLPPERGDPVARLQWQGDGYSAEARPLRDSSVVGSIALDIERSVDFNAVKAAFGEPSHLYIRRKVGDNPFAHSLVIVYLHRGFALTETLVYPSNVDRVLEGFRVRGFVLVPPDDLETLSRTMWRRADPGDSLVPWAPTYTIWDYCGEAGCGDPLIREE